MRELAPSRKSELDFSKLQAQIRNGNFGRRNKNYLWVSSLQNTTIYCGL